MRAMEGASGGKLVRMPVMMQNAVRAAGRFHTSLLRRFGGSGRIGWNILILTTRGRRSGHAVSTPLFHVSDRDRLYVVASFGGNDEPPGWYKNLLANPDVEVEVGGKRARYRARTLAAEETEDVWPKLLAVWPSYASYQKKTTRLIPIVELVPIAS